MGSGTGGAVTDWFFVWNGGLGCNGDWFAVDSGVVVVWVTMAALGFDCDPDLAGPADFATLWDCGIAARTGGGNGYDAFTIVCALGGGMLTGAGSADGRGYPNDGLF